MNWIDIVILVSVVWAAAQGYRRGLVREVLGLASTALVFIVGFRYAAAVGDNLGAIIGFEPGPIAATVGFLAISFGISAVLGLVMFIWRGFSRATRLSGVDSLGGAAFGTAKSLLVVLILLVLLSTISPKGFQPLVRSSWLAPGILQAAPVLYSEVEKYLPAWPQPAKEAAPKPSEPRRPLPRFFAPWVKQQQSVPSREEWRET